MKIIIIIEQSTIKLHIFAWLIKMKWGIFHTVQVPTSKEIFKFKYDNISVLITFNIPYQDKISNKNNYSKCN